MMKLCLHDCCFVSKTFVNGIKRRNSSFAILSYILTGRKRLNSFKTKCTVNENVLNETLNPFPEK